MTHHEPDRLRAPPPSRSVALAPRRRRSLSIQFTPISQSIGRSYPSPRHRDPHCALPPPLRTLSRPPRASFAPTAITGAENQIPIAPAARTGGPISPRLRASTLFGRRLAERAESFVVAGVQKPAQLRSFVARAPRQVEWAGCRTDLAGRDPQVPGRGGEATMTEQQLSGGPRRGAGGGSGRARCPRRMRRAGGLRGFTTPARRRGGNLDGRSSQSRAAAWRACGG